MSSFAPPRWQPRPLRVWLKRAEQERLKREQPLLGGEPRDIEVHKRVQEREKDPAAVSASVPAAAQPDAETAAELLCSLSCPVPSVSAVLAVSAYWRMGLR